MANSSLEYNFHKCTNDLAIFSSKYSNSKKNTFFDKGMSWAKNITVFSRRMNKALRASTRQNALNSRASPGKY